MMEIKDPAFKLFGKTIPVAGDGDGVDSPRESNASSNFSGQHDVEDKVCVSILIDCHKAKFGILFGFVNLRVPMYSNSNSIRGSI